MRANTCTLLRHRAREEQGHPRECIGFDILQQTEVATASFTAEGCGLLAVGAKQKTVDIWSPTATVTEKAGVYRERNGFCEIWNTTSFTLGKAIFLAN